MKKKTLQSQKALVKYEDSLCNCILLTPYSFFVTFIVLLIVLETVDCERTKYRRIVDFSSVVGIESCSASQFENRSCCFSSAPFSDSFTSIPTAPPLVNLEIQSYKYKQQHTNTSNSSSLSKMTANGAMTQSKAKQDRDVATLSSMNCKKKSHEPIKDLHEELVKKMFFKEKQPNKQRDEDRCNGLQNQIGASSTSEEVKQFLISKEFSQK